MNPKRTDLLQTRFREKDSAENESLPDIDNDDSDEDDNSESSSERDESNDVTLAFIDDDEEVAVIDDEGVERPTTTRSGIAITRRSEIDFSFIFLLFNEFKVYSELTHFSLADLVQLKVANATVVLIVSNV